MCAPNFSIKRQWADRGVTSLLISGIRQGILFGNTRTRSSWPTSTLSKCWAPSQSRVALWIGGTWNLNGLMMTRLTGLSPWKDQECSG
jgi:hypothetical protein